MDEVAEFLPIKLSPGFICVAFHLGCIGCNFCSVRYGNSRDRLFAAGLHRTYPTRPNDVYNLLKSMPSFSKARVPIRLGNDTDLRFELDDAVELIELIPADYPVAVLSRFPMSERDAAKLSRGNIVVKLTATPQSAHLTSPDNAAKVVASAEYFQASVLLTIGPVTADNWLDCLRLIDTIPRRASISVYIKPLNPEFHPSLAAIPTISAEQYQELRCAVAGRGFRHVSHLMCCVNGGLRLAHKRVSDVPSDEQADCQRCASFDLCYLPDDQATNLLLSELKSLGLTATSDPVRRGYRSYFLEVGEEAGYGDEAYLSEIVRCKVKLSGTLTGTGRGSYAASRAVLRRWQHIGFFPYDILLQKVQPFIEESLHIASAGINRNRLGQC